MFSSEGNTFSSYFDFYPQSSLFILSEPPLGQRRDLGRRYSAFAFGERCPGIDPCPVLWMEYHYNWDPSSEENFLRLTDIEPQHYIQF